MSRPRGNNDRLLTVLLLVVLIAPSSVFATRYGVKFVSSVFRLSWPEAQATVQTVNIKSSGVPGKEEKTFAVDLIYRFAEGGREIETSATLSQGKRREKGLELARRYPAGTKITVRYDPRDPVVSDFASGPDWASGAFFGAGLFFFSLGLFFAYLSRGILFQ